ncbi:G2/M phase-specific E3 ubiquitin-protein ligase [Dissostichus eleginoides]|uniref:G2/M phase-specific E3 ubiquitin-protein ligase n=1 Tax=Dissostichus eleginoides TaxID=100907 RepID=A0AAD9C6D6_DISEL|nr:G2/M phase-specific E3 ubiquitin-protein ligase [Dissostichus eleginoides]
MEYRSSKSKEKQSFNCGKVRLKQERRQVQINIGMMSPQGVDLKPRRGKTLPLFTDPEIAAPVLLERAVQKMRAFNKDMDEGPYILLYPDCSEVVNVPGSEKPFTLAEYKKDLGKAYARITLFICLEKHFRGGDDTSDSDSEIVITSRSTAKFNQADTVVFEFEPRNQSTPKHKPENEGKALGHSSTTQHGQIVISDTEDMGPPKTNTNKTTCYSTYTDLYAPCVEEEDEELVAVNMTSVLDTEMEEMNVTLPAIIANLSQPIDHGRVNGHRFLVYNANAVREDEYYLAGKMIAVSVVHGGPGPHFLSEDLVRYLAGQPSFKATVNLITDEEVGKALEEIENAASVDALREMTMRHSTMLQTAGCLRHVASVEEKKGIVSDYLQWYIIGRNSSVIDRFKEGLSALQFLNALQQHPTLLAPVLCHSEKRLTALELERLFKPDLSPPGSNRRLGESQTLGYWADYLLDCEGL